MNKGIKILFGVFSLSLVAFGVEIKEIEKYFPTKEITKNVVNLKEIKIKDAESLKVKLKNLKDGEILVIEDGNYSNLGSIEINSNNVTIKAKKPGNVIFSGLVEVKITGDNNTLEGIVFTNGGPVTGEGAIVVQGNKNKIRNNTVYEFNNHKYEANEKGEYNSTRWMTVSGKENVIINNRFEGKYRRGTLLVINNSKELDNHILANNIFKNHKANLLGEFKDEKVIRLNSNSWEAIRVGDSKTSLNPSGTALAYNLFDNMDGETELVSIKACKTLFKGNTVVESASMVSLRHGNESVVEDNVILGNEKPLTGGIRFYGEDHIIRNNYVENVTGIGETRGGIVVNTGVNDVAKNEKLDNSVKGKELNKQWTPKNVMIENNTVINSQQNFLYSGKVHKVSLYDNSKVKVIYPAVDITLVNNLSYAAEEGKKAFVGAGEDKNPLGTKYINNVFYGEIEKVDIPKENITEKKLDLKKINGIYETENKKIGAKNLKPLNENVVGPNYIIKK